LFVILQNGLPTGLAYNHAQPNLLRIGQKLVEADDGNGELMGPAKRRCSIGIAS